MKEPISVMWFRRDLRLFDNAALYHALRSGFQVLPVFIFDKHILDKLETKNDSRVSFIHDVVSSMNLLLKKTGSAMQVYYSTPLQAFEELFKKFEINAVFTNQDFEAYALNRDALISELCKKHNADFKLYKDQVIFAKDEVVKADGSPYGVFTPYSNRWKETLNDFYLKPYPVKKYWKHLLKHKPGAVPSLESMGFAKGSFSIPSADFPKSVINTYNKTRDFPGQEGTSRLGIHLRFGTISIRELATYAKKHNATYLNELIWRDFYQMILSQHEHVRNGYAYKREYDSIKWRNNEKEFAAWCKGQTGYPLVDAGMRQLNNTGFMHNRIRMVTASFLTKHLLIDWRWGEAYFAEKLLDFDFASNNGGWQWAAGSGCDAAPYFRIFNPELQQKRFDPKYTYIKEWVPEFGTSAYAKPIVDHAEARQRALKVYAQALKK